jgi:hypothetical protein
MYNHRAALRDGHGTGAWEVCSLGNNELTHTQLTTEVIGQLAGRFKPEISMIKKRIGDGMAMPNDAPNGGHGRARIEELENEVQELKNGLRIQPDIAKQSRPCDLSRSMRSRRSRWSLDYRGTDRGLAISIGRGLAILVGR